LLIHNENHAIAAEDVYLASVLCPASLLLPLLLLHVCSQLFEMDAFVGVDVLGLSFMKGDQPHAGFPEAAYHSMAEQLARAGYRVVVVEQVGGVRCTLWAAGQDT
jgi:hypothetical protein